MNYDAGSEVRTRTMEHLIGPEWMPVFTGLLKGLPWGAGSALGIAFVRYFFEWLSSREVRIPKGGKEFVFKGIGRGRQARELIEKLAAQIDEKKSKD